MTSIQEHEQKVRNALEADGWANPRTPGDPIESLDALVTAAQHAELTENGCEQALLLLERKRFADDAEARVVRAVLRAALAAARNET